MSRAILSALALAVACDAAPTRPPAPVSPTPPASTARPRHAEPSQVDDGRAAERARMVDEQILARGISDNRVLAAMRRVPRHEFVAAAHSAAAYEDRPLPIEAGQTISQPYIVALMTELARVGPGDRVLEVGTGSGYQAAVLAALGAEVYSIEIVDELARSAARRLAALGFRVTVRSGDGYAGWREHAPFSAIIVTAAPPSIPQPLKDQLALGGRLVIPVGDAYQELIVVTRLASGFEERRVLPVRFVPMTGEAQERPAGR